MEEFLRLKSGFLTGDTEIIPIHFGIVFNDGGLYRFDIYVAEIINLRELYNNKTRNFFRQFFTLKATTVDNNHLIAERLSVNAIPFDKGLIKIVCLFRMIHLETSNQFYKLDRRETKKRLYYIELEGLKMQFTHHTEVIQARDGKHEDWVNDINRDYTRGIFAISGKNKDGSCNVKWIWQKKRKQRKYYSNNSRFGG